MIFLYVINKFIYTAKIVFWDSPRHTRKLFKEINIDTYNLSEKAKRRIHFYIVQALLVNSWVSTLKGRKFSQKEIRRSVLVGAITPLMDDFTDLNKTTSPELLNQFDKPRKKSNNELGLSQKLWDELALNDKTSTRSQSIKTLQAQDASIPQLETQKLSTHHLEEITRNKGGLSTFLYWSITNTEIIQKEEEAVMTLGYALQQVNDMFDIYKDYKDGQQTLYTNSTDINSEYNRYINTIDEIFSQFLSLNYDKAHIKNCLIEISIILGRGMVCINQLKVLQDKSGTPFNVENFNRISLICDMEKPMNIWKSFKYSVEMLKRI